MEIIVYTKKERGKEFFVYTAVRSAATVLVVTCIHIEQHGRRPAPAGARRHGGRDNGGAESAYPSETDGGLPEPVDPGALGWRPADPEDAVDPGAKASRCALLLPVPDAPDVRQHNTVLGESFDGGRAADGPRRLVDDYMALLTLDAGRRQ
jgi:hypothetical protein